MADRNLMTPSTTSFGGLLGNGVIYRVPTFQRDYSWYTDHLMDLWDDIKIAMNSNSDHYMGSVVVQKDGEKKFLVIDGQQRFTTLSILALAVIKNIQDLIEATIEPTDNSLRIDELRRNFLGQRDPASLHHSSKLILNENNDAFYNSHLLQLRVPVSERSLQFSDKLMWQAFQFFYKAIKAHFGDAVTGSQLATFLSRVVGDRLMFIKIEVEDELSAYTLFETLNYRGKDLSPTDLLKNYLFSRLSSIDLNIAREMWKRISVTVGLDKFPAFLRHYWISRNDLVREEQLFKVIRHNISSVEHVFQLLHALEALAPYYIALQDPYNQEWQGQRERRRRIREFKLFGIKQQLPMLLSAKERFTPEEFDKLLRLLSVIAFRYNIVGNRHTNLPEDLFNKASKRIYRNEITTARQVYEAIKEVYVSDTDFRSDFSTLEVVTLGRKKKLAQYILFELENHLAGTDRDYEDDPATIEHILPENATADWDAFFSPVIQGMYVYRLGNYTLLENNLNRDCGNMLLSDKKVFYARSQYEMPKCIQSPEWNPNNLDNRQETMAAWATACWRVAYADISVNS